MSVSTISQRFMSFAFEASGSHLHVACTSVEVEMAALDLAKVDELINDFFLGRFLVHVGHDDDPSFDGCI